MPELQNHNGEVIARRGWAVVDEIEDVRPSDNLPARRCEQCGRIARPYHKNAHVCVGCWSKDCAAAESQRQQQVREAYKKEQQ
jgi:uncharacterized OB-fold protein